MYPYMTRGPCVLAVELHCSTLRNKRSHRGLACHTESTLVLLESSAWSSGKRMNQVIIQYLEVPMAAIPTRPHSKAIWANTALAKNEHCIHCRKVATILTFAV
eukprot:5720596-Amphidinium_carterae.2